MPRKVDILYRGRDQLTPVTKKVNKGIKQQRDAVRQLDASMQGLNGVVQMLGGTFAVAAAGMAVAAAGMWKLTTSAANAGDAMFDMSRKFGLTVEFVSQMKFVAEQSGSSIESLGTAIRTLSKNSLAGSAQFNKWNVETKNLNGTMKNGEDLFMSAVKRINELGSSTEKTAAAQDLFGRAGTDLLQVIHLGEQGIAELSARHDELVTAMDSGSAVAANNFNNKLGELDTTVTDLKNELGDELIPAMTALVSAATSVVVWTRAMAKENKILFDILNPLKGAYDLSVKALSPLVDALGLMDEVTADLEASERALIEQQYEAATSLVTLGEKASTTTKKIKKLKEAVEDLDFSEFSGVDLDFDTAIADDAKKTAEDVMNAKIAAQNQWADEYKVSEDKRISLANAARDDEQAAQEEYQSQLVAFAESTAQAIGSTMVTGMRDVVSAVGEGEAAMEAALTNMAKSLGETVLMSIVNNLVSRGIDALINAIFTTVETGADIVAITSGAIKAEAVIGQSSAEAMAQSLAAYAGIPFVGPALGAAQGAALVASIQASRGLMAAAEGGLIVGGTSGRDSVPLMAMPDERILSVDDNKKLMKRLDGGSVTYVAQSIFPESGNRTRQKVRSLEKQQRLYAAMGV